MYSIFANPKKGKVQEWLNWPAWKASKRQKRFRGSNPLLSALATTDINVGCFFIGSCSVSKLPPTTNKKTALHAVVARATVGDSHSLGVTSVVYFRTAQARQRHSLGDDAQ